MIKESIVFIMVATKIDVFISSMGSAREIGCMVASCMLYGTLPWPIKLSLCMHALVYMLAKIYGTILNHVIVGRDGTNC